MTQALALVTPLVGVSANGALFSGVGFFEGGVRKRRKGLETPLVEG